MLYGRYIETSHRKSQIEYKNLLYLPYGFVSFVFYLSREKAMIILGVDPGLAKTGCAVIKVIGDRLAPLTYGVISTKKEETLARRLKAIYDGIGNLCREYSPDVVAIEEIFFAANVKTAVAVAQARGVAILATEECGLALAQYSPLRIKQTIVGYGRATKEQVQKMVKEILSLDKIPRPDHAADALAVALCHAFHNNVKVMPGRPVR